MELFAKIVNGCSLDVRMCSEYASVALKPNIEVSLIIELIEKKINQQKRKTNSHLNTHSPLTKHSNVTLDVFFSPATCFPDVYITLAEFD